MIDRKPTGADWSIDLLDIYGDFGSSQSMQVFDSPAKRISALLGPDGEPLEIEAARMAIGFDLRPKGPRA